MNKIVEYFNGLKAKINLKIKHKKAIIKVTAFVLAICILVSVISFVKSFKTPEMFESDARIVVDCGIRVGFVVDENFIVSEVFACEKKYEKYIEDIRYESDFVKAITHVFNHAQAENYVYNVDYFAVFLINHKRHGTFAAVENAFEVNGCYSVKFLLSNIRKEFLLSNSCVVDKHRNAAEKIGGVCKNIFD